MKYKHRQCILALTLNSNAGEAGILHLNAEHVLNRATEHQTQDHAGDAGMPYDQHTLPGMRGTNPGPGRGHPRLKTRERLGALRPVSYRITPEIFQAERVISPDVIGCAALPAAKTDFLQTFVDFDWQREVPGQLLREIGATPERRTVDDVPILSVQNGGTHLLPTLLAQRVVRLPTIASTAHGFAMAQQIDLGPDRGIDSHHDRTNGAGFIQGTQVDRDRAVAKQRE